MNCETHADREGSLAVDLPSLRIRRYLCDECRAELRAFKFIGNPRNNEAILQGLTDEDKVNAYADAMIRREKLRGYSDDANRAQEDRERMEYNRRMG